MSIISQPDLWKDINDDTPPVWWNALDTDDKYYFYDNDPSPNPGDVTTVTLLDAADLPDSLTFAWEIVTIDPDPFPPALPLILRTTRNAVNTDTVLGIAPGSGTVTISGLAGATSFSFAVRTSGTFPYDPQRMYGNVVALGDVIVPPPACDELGRATRAYVSGYDRTRVQQVRLYRFERRCLTANFNGAFPPARTIASATWRIDAPEIGVISTPQISVNQRETMLMFASQLGGWANVRAEVTLDNGEIYNQIFRINVREGSWFFNDQAIVTGPFSVSVSV